MSDSQHHQQQQQQQQPQVQTIVITQPVMVRRGVPFMMRGAKICNGTVTCGAFLMSFIVIIGAVLCKLGFVFVVSSVGGYISILLLLIGAVVLGSGIYLCCLASSQFKALPPDHPDRVKYSAQVAVPVRGANAVQTQIITTNTSGSPTTQHLLAGQPGTYPLQPGTYPPQPGTYPVQLGPYSGQPGTYPPQPGTYPPQLNTYPPQEFVSPSGQPVTPQPAAGQTHPSAPHSLPYMDNPPPYSEIQNK